MNKFMSSISRNKFLEMGRERGVLQQEIQVLWDEIGETEEDRERMMLEMEQECLEVYKRNVDKINRSRVEILQAIADSETEFEDICSALGEPNFRLKKTKQNASSLKEVLKESFEQLDVMQKVKSDRLNQFLEIIDQIRRILIEIGQTKFNPSLISLNEFDLSVRKLEELQRKLHLLESEKTDRLNLVIDHLSTLKSLCLVLGLNYEKMVYEIHPTLKEAEDKKSITDDAIEKLGSAIESLRNVKLERMQQLQDLATTMLELWHLMDTPIEEQQSFRRVTCNIAASEHEITEPNALSIDFINHVALEVSRLEGIKASKLKELILKKMASLDELRRGAHLVAASDNNTQSTIEAIDTGAVDPSIVLDQIESEICNAKDEVFSRKEILEKVEKWIAACEEESWLEEYNRDENRYSAGKGAHLALRRAEKARATVNKIPGMVETLIAKTVMWEKDREKEFTYDSSGLLSMMESYMNARQEKEQEKKRQREQRRLQSQQTADQPSPLKPQNMKKLTKSSSSGRKPNTPISTPRSTSFSRKCDEEKGMDGMSVGRKPFVALVSEDNWPATPTKMAAVEVEESGVPGTMQMADQNVQEVEYSFEERRAGFVLSSAHMNCVQK
ncbi:65-kDa microtubule-associated protein 9-like [Dioscorea cayenensis subsp. rotundata]|uniref:65-kDa microtubule-associated protein 9-like n=1 Tax=Dioscorea cayennensis subsp. rotundata TaxID=55577 RepID=A0AB40C668_DIOCR|nr:65-kDa microtubule-associated protein 9-like [Dioscorea cayenensis subsp. rotundata]